MKIPHIHRRIKKMAIHIGVWSLLFLLNNMFIDSARVKIDFAFLAGVWLIYTGLFYINYSLCMPLLFFRKRMFFYFLIIVPLLLGSYFLKQKLARMHMDKFFIANEKTFPPNPPMEFEQLRGPMSKPPFGSPGAPPNEGLFPRFDFMALYGTLLVFTASTSLAFMQKWQRDEHNRNDYEKEKITAELRYLQQQINPHFLFNALNSVYSLTLGNPAMATDAVLKLSSILRYMLYETSNRKVTLVEEMEVVRNYIDIQKLRLNNKVKINYYESGINDTYIIEPLILIPLLENAFKYGADNFTPSYIQISIKVINDVLEADISNSIVHRPADKADSGIGLKNIVRRLSLLYTGEHTLIFSEKADVFTVMLHLNLKRSKNILK